MKRFGLFIAVLSALLLLGAAFTISRPESVPALTQQSQVGNPDAECPAGSYPIDHKDGAPICKAEPTGCPYGDSIPLDSPKCAPANNSVEGERKFDSAPAYRQPVVELGK